jgi:hypothetical protein
MNFNEFSDGAKLLRRKASILAKTNRLQPKFTYQFITLHMDMLRLTAIEAVKEEAIGAGDIFYGWHVLSGHLIIKKGALPNPLTY